MEEAVNYIAQAMHILRMFLRENGIIENHDGFN
jgi:hypothetical protein